MVAILHCLWLSSDDFFYVTMVINTYGQPDVVGGVTSTDDRSALTTGPTPRPRTRCRNDPVNVLVDSDASGHSLDNAIIARVRDRLNDYKVLDVPRKRPTARELNGTEQRVLPADVVVDDKGV